MCFIFQKNYIIKQKSLSGVFYFGKLCGEVKNVKNDTNTNPNVKATNLHYFCYYYMENCVFLVPH